MTTTSSRWRRSGALAVAALLAVLLVGVGGALGKFRKGLADARFGSASSSAGLLNTADAAGAEVVRIDVAWRKVAPGIEPIEPRNPASYNWGDLPAAVAAANARGLDVLLTVYGAPDWAEGAGRPDWAPTGTWKPDPTKLGEFAHAIATRFKGQVRNYQAWNEPNIYTFLNPQYEGRKLVGPGHYRRMLNAFYAGINAEQPGAKVITAGTAPYGEPRGGRRTRPLTFWRKVLCLEGRRALKPAPCPTRARFDALAHHPINTSGGPRRSAVHPDDASTPDLKHVVRTLRKAESSNRVAGRHAVWVTEFWWESRPPDRCTGVPLKRHARWTKQALRSFRRQGASVALSYLVRDEPYQSSACGRGSFQTGLVFADGDRKPAFRAFRRFGR